jgi:hypothetical protein
MKKHMLLALAFIFFFITATAVVSRAQTVGLRVNIPFDFNVSERVLPAGDYLILAPKGQMLKLLGPNGTGALALTNPVSGTRPTGAGVVVFNCYGERCFLSRFWTARTGFGQEVLKSGFEKKLSSQKEMVAVITLRGRAN